MKQTIYLLPVLLLLVLGSCKKKEELSVSLEGTWRKIRWSGEGSENWDPERDKSYIRFENGHYTRYRHDTVTSRGTYTLMTVTEWWSEKKKPAIRFENSTFEDIITRRGDTLSMTGNNYACGYSFTYVRATTAETTLLQ
ncbi:hypothetical protein [Chitinophaga japonensis]|uniref:Lipocalin-like protein n=1 Tax=Chitinophaga japonensis TaxID=104662 RepID=A0A562TCS1_CHIJA|nr:hypothetical protein [Chitinophaga japonensis]TWI90876.1 hypothetical protein LX66_0236 [Chitinophaga japonensis]